MSDLSQALRVYIVSRGASPTVEGYPRSVIYLKMNKKIQLHGGGVAVKSYIHIRDISRGELAATEKGRLGTIYHLSPDRGHAVGDVGHTICDLMGRDLETSTVVVGERLGQDAAYVVDSTRGRTKLGWQPRVTLQEGLKEVVEWINNNWQEIQKQPLEYEHKR